MADPLVMLTIPLSSVYMDLEDDMSFIQVLTYMLYHAVLRMYHVTNDGKYCVDTLQLDLLVMHLKKLNGNYEICVCVNTNNSKQLCFARLNILNDILTLNSS